MPLEAAKCPSCDANIEVPADRETVFCAYCGSSIKSKAAIAYGNTVTIEGEVKVEGIATLEKLVQNANTYENLNEYKKAYEIYTRITEEYPNDYRGWLGVFVASMKTCFSTGNYETSEKSYNNACHLANTEEIKNKIEKIYEQEWLGLLDRIANGNYNRDQIKEFFDVVLSPHNYLDVDIVNGEENEIFDDLRNNQLKVANKYIKEFLLKAYDNSKYFGHTGYGVLLFQFGKIFISYKEYYGIERATLLIEINSKYITDKDIEDRRIKGLCVKCGGTYSLFGTCKNCGNRRVK